MTPQDPWGFTEFTPTRRGFLKLKASLVACIAAGLPREILASEEDEFQFPVGFEPPQLPKTEVDIDVPLGGGKRIDVRSGHDLQSVVDRAGRGDNIWLEPGGVWNGPLTLPQKSGDGWINIRTEAELPAKITRDWKGQDSLPTLITKGAPGTLLGSAPRASHYFIQGLRVKSADPERNWNILATLSRGNSTDWIIDDPSDLSHHLIFDRCAFIGWPGNTMRGILMEANDCALVNSIIDDITHHDESHGVLLLNSVGRVLIQNNSIAASGENIFVGNNHEMQFGAPIEDITIRGNLILKNPEWAQLKYQMKNHIELKRGRRVLVEDNECRCSRPGGGQQGWSFTTKTGGGGQITEDVTYRRNRSYDLGGWVEHTCPSEGVVDRVVYEDNYAECAAGSDAIYLAANHPMAHVGFVRNQVVVKQGALNTVISMAGRPGGIRGCVFAHNKMPTSRYGIHGSGVGSGKDAIRKFVQNFLGWRNTMPGQATALYPPYFFS